MSDKLKTLSQAIRLGATFRPQCRKEFFSRTGSCALGAGAEAIGVTGYDHDIARLLIRRFPVVFRLACKCPVTYCSRSGSGIAMIAHLNDDHEWTREAIADWLEGRGL